MIAVLFAFACGISVGALIGRRSVRAPAPAAAAAALPTRPVPEAVAPPPTPLPAPSPGLPAKGGPTAKARKAGITEEAFIPSDDILEKLRKAAEGELDPAVLAEEPEPPRSPPAAPALPTEAEQRVLDRLRRLAEDGEGEGTDPA